MRRYLVIGIFLCSAVAAGSATELKGVAGQAAATRAPLDKVLEPTPGSGTTGVVYASTSLKCGGTVYHVSTGNEQGTCTGKGSSRTCTDGKGNSARASCAAGCGTVKGAGACTISAK